jgi:flagellar hook-length control protein FliK
MGRPARHPASAGGLTASTPQAPPAPPASAEPSARVNAAAFNIITNAANAASMAPREDGGARSAPSGIMATNAGDISMLNPPRLSTQAGAALPQFTIPAGAGQRAWAEEIGNRVMWMLGRAQSRAELILTPPHLGKVEVSIHLNGDQGTAQFLASSQSAREALEQAMPRLRELLAQAGISLGEASVNTSAEDRAQDGEKPHRAGARAPDAHDGNANGDATAATAPRWQRLGAGLVNTFA